MICKTDPGRPRIDLAGKRVFLAGAVWLWERSLDSLFRRGIWIEVEGCLTAESRCRAGFVKDFFFLSEQVGSCGLDRLPEWLILLVVVDVSRFFLSC